MPAEPAFGLSSTKIIMSNGSAQAIFQYRGTNSINVTALINKTLTSGSGYIVFYDTNNNRQIKIIGNFSAADIILAYDDTTHTANLTINNANTGIP
jgi:hypothetical protein